MDDILSSNNGEEAVDSSNQANASNDSSAKSRSSSKRRPKTRSKVWEKVAWFTRKTKSGRENKAESPEEAIKGHKSPSLGVFRSEDEEGSQNNAVLNVTGNNLNSPSLCKAKSKSGIRKTKSFNYLKRKKLKHYVNEANSTLYEETKENSDPSTCQTATGNFHDFASVGRRSSSITTSSNNLVSEMAKEMNSKQEEQPKNSIKCSLSLPLSLLSLDEIPANVCGQRCQGFLCTCKPKTKSFSGPNYNSWPRKKRLLVSSQGYDAFSPPQKQKKICCLRKTATFSGFDSSKLSIEFKNTGNAELRGVKSTPLLSGQNQIKNQNGLNIGIIHFFKSSRNKCSNYNTVVAKEMVASGPILANDVNQFGLYCGSSTEYRNRANTDTDIVGGVDASNGINLHSDLEGKMTDSPNELLSTSNEQQSSKTSEDENVSEELGACANVGSFVSMKDCFMVEDPVNEVCSMALKNTSSHQEGINKANDSQQDIQEMSECSSTMMNDKNISLEAETRTSNVKLIDLDLALLNSSQQLCAIDKRAAYSKLEMIKEVPDSLAKVNEEDIESPRKYSKHVIVEKDGDQKDACSQSKATETGIYCIKIEDQVTDFSKEGKIDFHSQTKLQESSTFSENFVEKLKASAYTKEKTLFQCANNSNTSIPLCTMTSDSTEEEEREALVGKTTVLDDSALLRNVITVQEERPRSCMYNGEEMSQKVKNAVNSYVSVITPLNTPEENQRIENLRENVMKSNSHLSNRKLLQTAKPKVDGQHFKHQTETILDWFSEFNDEQKNILIKKLLEQCELPQMHLLSVAMEPVLHKTCPPNCQDMLAWLPHPVTNAVMSYLDPESLCRCSQVNRFWNSLASNPLIWKGLCKSSEWQLSRKTEENQLAIYTLPCGTVQWKKMFAERYLLRKNWLNGRCKVRTFEGHTQGISCVQFDDTRIVSGSTDKTIRVWDLSRDDSHAVLTLAGHSGTVRCLNLNGNRLVSGSVDRSIKVWDLSFESYWSGASCKVTMVGHMHTVRCLQVDDEKVVSGSYDKTLKVWDLKTGQCKLTLRGHNAAVLCVQFDDNKIVSGSYDNTIKVWSLHEGECLMTLAGHHDAVTCLNLTQDGRKVISGSLDHNLKFWDLATGKCIGTLDWIRSEGHTGVIRCLQSDSWRIVSAGDDKTLKMWSLETGQRLLTLRCHTDGVTCLQFNDYRIVSGSYDKTVKVWNFSPEHEFLSPS